MDPAERSVTRWAMLVMTVIVTVIALWAAMFVVLLDNRKLNKEGARTADLIVECTTPSTTPDDPHECYEEAQRNQDFLIASVIDSDKNSEIDTEEILEAISRFEPFLQQGDNP